jgi:hypothetical protein
MSETQNEQPRKLAGWRLRLVIALLYAFPFLVLGTLVFVPALNDAMRASRTAMMVLAWLLPISALLCGLLVRKLRS